MPALIGMRPNYGEPTGPFVLNKDSPQAQGLIFWMPGHPAFDIGANNGDQSLYRTRASTVTGDPTFAQFNDGSTGISLDSNDAIDFAHITPHNLAGDQASIMAWVHPNNQSSFHTVFGIPAGPTHTDPFWKIWLGSLNQEAWCTVSNASSDSFDIISGGWNAGTDHHHAGRYNGANIEVFVNGAGSGSPTTKTGNLRSSTEDIHIGHNAGGSEHLDGIVRDCRLYNYAMSDDQIAQCHELPWDLVYEPGKRAFFG